MSADQDVVQLLEWVSLRDTVGCLRTPVRTVEAFCA